MASFIDITLDTDADDLAQNAFNYLMANVPGFVPVPGDLTTFLIEALSRMVNEARIVASDVPPAIFRYFGKSILNLPAIEAVSATVTTTWTVQDNLGYTIPAGTTYAFKVSGNNLVPFKTTAPIVIAPGATTAVGVVLTATTPGIAANGIAGGSTLVPIDALAYVTSVVSTTASAGGVDAETDSAYLDRLADDLALLSPRPILPNDFAVLAKNVAGVFRATAIDLYWPGRVFTDGGITNGSPNLTSAAGAVFTADDVGRTVTAAAGIPGGTTILAYVGPTQVTMSANATATNAATTVTLGDLTAAPRAVTIAALDSAGNAVSGAIKTAIQTYLDGMREVNFHVSTIDPTITNITVLTSVKMASGYVSANVKAAVEAAVNAYLSKATWGGGDQTPPVWNNSTTVHYLSVAAVIKDVPGVDYIVSLTLNAGTVDVALGGIAAIPNGTCTATVT